MRRLYGTAAGTKAKEASASHCFVTRSDAFRASDGPAELAGGGWPEAQIFGARLPRLMTRMRLHVDA